eukprot:m.145731 g.145731  ORF g.145731 m.145731 type:complete len:64 (+) comp10082_c0_seq6:64-255(+)
MTYLPHGDSNAPPPPVPTLAAPARAKKLVSYIFHPFLPFAISVQHTILPNNANTSVTNFHIRL